MKKKKIILDIILVLLVLLCGTWLAYYMAESRYGKAWLNEWYYNKAVPDVLDFFGKSDFVYDISVESKTEILLDNGKREKELVVRYDYERYGYGNWIVQGRTAIPGRRNLYYMIKMYEGNEFTVRAKEEGILIEFGLRVTFRNHETVCEGLYIQIEKVPSVHIEVEEDFIRCKAGAVMKDGAEVWITEKLLQGTQKYFLDKLEYKVDAFEVRQGQSGPMIYFDLDGDGVYEHSYEDCTLVEEEETEAEEKVIDDVTMKKRY